MVQVTFYWFYICAIELNLNCVVALIASYRLCRRGELPRYVTDPPPPPSYFWPPPAIFASVQVSSQIVQLVYSENAIVFLRGNNSPVINSRGSLDNDLNRFLRSRDSSNNNLQNVCTQNPNRSYLFYSQKYNSTITKLI